MSYDLMVFAPLAPPPDRSGFMKWYGEQTKWAEGHNYNDPAVSTHALQNWFREMIIGFPAMNGPYASENIDDPKLTDYSIGKSVIYAGFAWSDAENAFEMAFRLAEKHRVGFFDVSTANGGVWVPSSEGYFSCVHGRGAPHDTQSQKWWKFWARK